MQVIAPECLVPDMSYIQRFAGVLALPFAVLACFLLWNTLRFLLFFCWYKQRGWKNHVRNMASSISIALLMVFL